MHTLLPIQFGNAKFGPWCKGVDPLIAELFDPADFIASPEPFTPTSMHDLIDNVADPNLFYIRYVTSSLAVRDRLELLGYTYDASAQAFEIAREGMLQNVKAVREEAAKWEDIEPMEDKLAALENYIDALKHHLTPEAWIQGLATIHQKNWDVTGSFWRLANLNPTLRAMLYADMGINFDFGFPRVSDRRHIFRLAVEALPPNELIQYDLTDCGRTLRSRASEILHMESRASLARLIVLTEGATDARILERALALFYPHLVNRVSVMNFRLYRVPGGTGPLSNAVKAFAGANIESRIVALFDNDAAGQDAMRALSALELPPNIALRCYPDLPVAFDYPTISAGHVSKMNINGLACAIEMYFGTDILMDSFGDLTPVELKGMNHGIGLPQGCLREKTKLLKAFEEKLTICEKNPERISEFDWNGITSILRVVLNAPHSSQALALVDRERDAWRRT
jgi:hypothetical protein